MAFFKVDKSEENIRDSGNSNYIVRSGIYPVTIKYVCVEQSRNGSEYLNLWVDYQGVLQPIYQAMRLTNNDGSPNLGSKLFVKFCIVTGVDEEVPDPEEMDIPVGKNGANERCQVLTVFNDIPVYMHIRMEYSIYNDKIQQAKVIRNFFRYEDKATASEIINNVEDKGKQFSMEEESCTLVTYKDGLTEDDIKAWIKEQKDKRNDSKSSNVVKSFGARRFTKRT